MNQPSYRPLDPQLAEIYCFCRRCAREVYSPADGVRIGAHMLCADCVRSLAREVRQ